MVAVVVDVDEAGIVRDAGGRGRRCSARRAAPAGARAAARRRPAAAGSADGSSRVDLAGLTPIDDVRGSAAYRLRRDRDADPPCAATALGRELRGMTARDAQSLQVAHLRVNGRAHEVAVDPVAPAVRRAARRPRPDRHQGRLPRRRLRRLHRAARRRSRSAPASSPPAQCEGRAVTTVEGLASAMASCRRCSTRSSRTAPRSAGSARRAC